MCTFYTAKCQSLNEPKLLFIVLRMISKFLNKNVVTELTRTCANDANGLM